MNLTKTSIAELIRAGLLPEAIKQREFELAVIAEENRHFVPSSHGHHHVVSDDLDGLVNPVDGKRYDSKSAYYRAVAAAGCNIIEDNPLARKRELRGDFDNTRELKNAIMEVTRGRGL